ncbi:hypothetical protein ATANTOWER_019060 [Ataeniobius toweri]|uniref:Secreted protein n=1 Tax=Ataeniobius toweri TaxID=208326 RepID=A0ABU7B806_9TELE|nr:hypothetical protein [Ataeniobius toweri]
MASCKVWTGVIGLTFVLAIRLFLCPQQAEKDATPHQRRWTPDGMHLRPIGGEDTRHPFLQNYWYCYVHDTAKARNKNDCYVCSLMPTHSQGPTVYAQPMNISQAKCAASFAGIGFQYYQLKINDSDPFAPGLKNNTCDTMFWVDFDTLKQNTTIPFTVHLKEDPTRFNHTMCYEQNRDTILTGNTTNCRQALVGGEGAPVNTGVGQ